MRMRVFILLLALIPSLALAAPPSPTPRPSEEDKLFTQLKNADSAEAAKPIEEKIGGLFRASGSASVDLLMSRVGSALGQADNSTARTLIEAAFVSARFAGIMPAWPLESAMWLVRQMLRALSARTCVPIRTWHGRWDRDRDPLR